MANRPAPHAHPSTQAVITPVESQRDSATKPRVARGSQPWAGGRNPFGIEARVKQNSGSHNTSDRSGVVLN
jgi:hypothetical protein